MLRKKTAQIKSKDYHDYVFKDGKLIGEFEEMYRNSVAVPWGQNKAYGKWYNKVSLAIAQRALEDSRTIKIHEVGCGLGYFISRFDKKRYRLSGSDISMTAIRNARRNFDQIAFKVDDIRIEKKRPRYDLVLISALFWYIYPQIRIVVKNISAMTDRQGYLFIAEVFPRLKSRFVGKNTISSPDHLIKWLKPYFQTIAEARVKRADYPNEEMVFYWLGKRK